MRALSPRLTSLAVEVLLSIYENQRRYRGGQWRFDGSLWSRSVYTVARAHGALMPSPAAGRSNVERRFEQRLSRVRARLLKLDMLTWRKVRPPEAPSRIAQGYKRHRAQNRDVFLTDMGLDRAEAELAALGRMALEGEVTCAELPTPSGPVAGGLSGCDD